MAVNPENETAIEALTVEATTPIVDFNDLLDAFADSTQYQRNGSIQLHDRDGLLLDTLRSWATRRRLAIVKERLAITEREWDCYEVDVGNGSKISIHDEQSTVRFPEEVRRAAEDAANDARRKYLRSRRGQ